MFSVVVPVLPEHNDNFVTTETHTNFERTGQVELPSLYITLHPQQPNLVMIVLPFAF